MLHFIYIISMTLPPPYFKEFNHIRKCPTSSAKKIMRKYKAWNLCMRNPQSAVRSPHTGTHPHRHTLSMQLVSMCIHNICVHAPFLS